MTELEAKLVAAKKVKDYLLCKLLFETLKMQKESDEALEKDDFDAVERLDAEVCAVFFVHPELTSSYLPLALDC